MHSPHGLQELAAREESMEPWAQSRGSLALAHILKDLGGVKEDSRPSEGF